MKMQKANRSLLIGILLLPITACWALEGTAAETSQAQPRVREIIIVFKTHFDIGYTDMASNIVQRYRTTMIDQALKVVDQNRDLPPEQQFAWTIPGWPMQKISEDWGGQKPERQAQIRQAFRDGRFVVHALPFTPHTELLEPEDLVHGLGYASRISRMAGKPLPRDAKMTDVPCHSWIIPTLLRNAGVDFLHLGCNAASSSPKVPTLFWWEGPDGSRVLTMYSAAGYGTGTIPPADWPYQTWLALHHTGDNHGPPTPDEVKALLDEAKVKLPGVKVRIGRLSDFADALLAEKAEIPVVRGDMPDTWIHGPMCDPAGAKIARNIRPAIATAESLNLLLANWGTKSSEIGAAITKAREQSLLYGEHTWGGAQYWITRYGKDTKWGYGETWKADSAAGRFKRLEDSWSEHTAYIENARDLVTPILASEMDGLAKSVAVEGRRVVVFNPLPWKRDGVVSVKLPGTAIAALQAVDSGAVVQADADTASVSFVAKDVPACGYRTYVPIKAEAVRSDLGVDSRTSSIENRWLRISLDPSRGAIKSVFDKNSGRELADNNGPQGFGQYLYERFDANNVAGYVKAYVKIKADWAVNELGKPSMPPTNQVPYRAASPRNCRLDFERHLTSVAAVMGSAPSAELGHGVTTRVILYANEPYVDLEVTVQNKPADPWPEAGWLCLPFKVGEPQFRLGRPGSIIDPAKDIVSGANRNLFGINTGLAIFDGAGRGIGLCAPDNPLLSLDKPGCWQYEPDFIPKRPRVYVNLFNNQWTTNFRMWNSGTWSGRVRLWAFEKYEAPSALINPALETRQSLMAAVAEGDAGKLSPTQRGLELSRSGVLLTAFGPNSDGPGTVLRLWEYSGVAGDCEVRLPGKTVVKEVQPVNLRGEPVGKPIVVNNNAFTTRLNAYTPASFVIP